MKLFYEFGACSLAPHIILRETGLPFSIERINLATRKTESGEDFYKISPKGQVPTLLLDDGSILTEGVAILQYLADQAPEHKLMPTVGSLARYHAIEALNYIATELHKGFIPLFNAKTPEAYKIMVREKLAHQFNYLNNLLKDRQFMLGSQFTVADAYLFTVVRWAHHVNIDLSSYPALVAYCDRIAARPTVQAAIKAEKPA